MEYEEHNTQRQRTKRKKEEKKVFDYQLTSYRWSEAKRSDNCVFISMILGNSLVWSNNISFLSPSVHCTVMYV